MTPAVGVANAYDSVLVIARAIEKAKSADPAAIRNGLYDVDQVNGLIKTYDKPFTKARHDALTEKDYIWTRFEDNHIMPVAQK